MTQDLQYKYEYFENDYPIDEVYKYIFNLIDEQEELNHE